MDAPPQNGFLSLPRLFSAASLLGTPRRVGISSAPPPLSLYIASARRLTEPAKSTVWKPCFQRDLVWAWSWVSVMQKFLVYSSVRFLLTFFLLPRSKSQTRSLSKSPRNHPPSLAPSVSESLDLPPLMCLLPLSEGGMRKKSHYFKLEERYGRIRPSKGIQVEGDSRT